MYIIGVLPAYTKRQIGDKLIVIVVLRLNVSMLRKNIITIKMDSKQCNYKIKLLFLFSNIFLKLMDENLKFCKIR